MLQNKIKDKFNGIQVTNFHSRSTEPLNYRINARPQSSKQDDQSFTSILRLQINSKFSIAWINSIKGYLNKYKSIFSSMI